MRRDDGPTRYADGVSARALLLTACLAAGCRATAHNPAPIAPREPSPLDAPRSWLEALGLTLEGATIPVVKVSEAEAMAELSRRNDALWPEDRVLHIVGMTWLMLGDEALSVDIEMLRQGMRQGAARPAIAYYDRERIALVDKEAAALAPAPLILTHELVHAYQDQQLPGGVFETLQRADTLDALSTLQLTIEGHAEFVSTAAFVAGRGVDLRRLTPAFFDSGVGHLDNPSTSFLYERGALAMLGTFTHDGMRGVDALLRAPPSSSEQLLHPAKLGQDAPTRIDVPVIPGATPQRSSTIGELTLRNLLASRIVDEGLLLRATTGWDGDTLTWYEGETGPLLVWRTVWDREVDVDQFLEAWQQFGQSPSASAIVADGRRIDFVALPPGHTEEQAHAIAGALPTPPLPPADGAASTTTAERAALADLASKFAIRGGRVEFRHSGVRIPIPTDWGVVHSRGVPFLRGPMIQGFGDTVVVSATPNLLGFTLDEVARETLITLRDVLGAAILEEERRSVACHDAWLLESRGHDAGSQLEMHQIRLVFFTQTHRVSITFSALPDRWGTRGPLFREMIAGLEPAKAVCAAP